ncbi:MAG: hypothetical protein RI885_2009, partial [Actinomycetota bacterium]
MIPAQNLRLFYVITYDRRMTDDLEARLERLESRVRDLERTGGGDSAPGAGPAVMPSPNAVDPEIFWALTRLRAEVPAPGGVLFTGAVDLPSGTTAHWQLGATTTTILKREWDGFAPMLSA